MRNYSAAAASLPIGLLDGAVATWIRVEDGMGSNLVKRASKKIVDGSVTPLLRHSFRPFINEVLSRLDAIGNQVLVQRERMAGEAKRGIAVADAMNSTIERLILATDRIVAHSHPSAGEIQRLRAAQSELRQQMTDLRAAIARETPDNPTIHGFKVFAQTDEDGIIENILGQVPDHSKTFIEIGCGNGLENNTHYLLLKNYRGAWVDGSDDNIAFIENALGGLKLRDLLVKKSFVSSETIAGLIDELCCFIGTKEPGFFSLDIDGNDFHVLARALQEFRPVTICVEYNAKFPPPLQIAMRYDPSHRWAGDDYHGASLQSFCDLLVDYKLVACNLTGVNAFFVRRDRAGLFADYAPRKLYQPFREDLIDLRAEHRPSLKWLRDKLV